MPEPEQPGVSMLVGGATLVADLPPATGRASEASLVSSLDPNPSMDAVRAPSSGTDNALARTVMLSTGGGIVD